MTAMTGPASPHDAGHPRSDDPRPDAPGAGVLGSGADIRDLIACRHCDALHRAEVSDPREWAFCRRCGTVLIAPQMASFGTIAALALCVVILMVAAVSLPFLRVSAAGLSNALSVIETVAVFATTPQAPLSLAVAALIVGIPVIRALLTAYVLIPMAHGRPPLKGATFAFRAQDRLRPWAMAEVFIIGVAVALVKITSLAKVDIGAAFWFFAGLVVLGEIQDRALSRASVWTALAPAS